MPRTPIYTVSCSINASVICKLQIPPELQINNYVTRALKLSTSVSNGVDTIKNSRQTLFDTLVTSLFTQTLMISVPVQIKDTSGFL